MKKRYSEEQIIKAIKQHEAGAKVEDICRGLGISTGTFYNWRSKYAGLEVNEAKRLRELESENAKLKKLLADKLLEVEAMKDVLSKSGEARQEEADRRASGGAPPAQRTDGVPPGRAEPNGLSLSSQADGRPGTAGALEKLGSRAHA